MPGKFETMFSLLKGSNVFRSHFVREIEKRNNQQSGGFVFKNDSGSGITW